MQLFGEAGAGLERTTFTIEARITQNVEDRRDGLVNIICKIICRRALLGCWVSLGFWYWTRRHRSRCGLTPAVARHYYNANYSNAKKETAGPRGRDRGSGQWLDENKKGERKKNCADKHAAHRHENKRGLFEKARAHFADMGGGLAYQPTD